MEGMADFASRDLLGSQLTLSDELIFTPQIHGEEIYYHLEVPSEGIFYSVGYSEYVFISLLDGNTSVAQAITETARTLGSQALSQHQGSQTAKWLIDNNLVRFSNSASGSIMGKSKNQSLVQRMNPFWMKWSLGSPDRLLSFLSLLFGWLFSVPATLLGIGIILFGAGSLFSNWNEFSANVNGILSSNNWLYLALAWVVLKVVHELGHGIACKYYGGEVRDTGLIFILFAPLAYVDVTSCWRFSSKWQRIHVAAAGMYVELIVAAVAAIILSQGASPVTQNFLQNLIVMASVSTLVFNANPLMRFDGYYIFSDLFEIPNLASEANRYLTGLLKRVFYGVKIQPLRILGFRLWCIRVYSIASAVWRLLICVSLTTAASVLFSGAGVVLAVLGIVIWFVVPCFRLLANLQQQLYESPTTFVRSLTVTGTIALVLIATWNWLPWPAEMTAPVIVEYSDLATIRSESAGFVTRINVRDGQYVNEGDLLLQLRNGELESRTKNLQIDLQRKESLHRITLSQANSALAQVAERNVQAAEVRLTEAKRQVNALAVRADTSGKIIARNLEQKIGTYLQQGDAILAIGNEQSKELLVSIGQEEIEKVLPQIGQLTNFRVSGTAMQSGKLDRIDPRASVNLPHPAMSTANGGPLSISLKRTANSGQQLVVPRFRGVIALPTEISSTLGAGEQGQAMFGLRQESVGEYLSVKIYYWFESILKPSPGNRHSSSSS
ncbi:MAG: hypothetical protein COA78_08940 [Blastopirellula sp.]|nr:MAG: hypothetical protein COA78_08940 [Blastopirellula sp.]